MDCSMESIWTCPWNPWWICLNSIWNPLESMWNSDGFHMELTIPWPFHDHSMIIPWSFHMESMMSMEQWIGCGLSQHWFHGFHMDYTRECKDLHNIWDGNDHFSKSSADWSETAKPLPSIPESELMNPVVTKTIRENPRLFKIVTPIYVDRFENLLQSHPNQPFVKSMCQGLCEGFWLWANSHIWEYPDTLNLSYPEPDNPD